MDAGEYTGSVKDLINLTQNLDCFEFYPGVKDEEELGRMYILEFEALTVPEHLIDYIDYEAYGRDVRINEGGHLPPAAMCSTIRVNSSSTIPGWTIFPRNTAFPMSKPGTRRRKHAPSWRQSSSSRRIRLFPTRTRRSLPMRNSRPRAKLAGFHPGGSQGPPDFPKFPGGKEAVCRNM